MTVKYQCNLTNAVFQCPKHIAQLQVTFEAQIYNKRHMLDKKDIKCEMANVKLEDNFTLIFPKIGSSWSQDQDLDSDLESDDKERILFNLTDSKQMILDRGPHIIQTQNFKYKVDKLQAIRMNEATQRKFQEIIFLPAKSDIIIGTFENPEGNYEHLQCISKMFIDRDEYGQPIGNRRVILQMHAPTKLIQVND